MRIRKYMVIGILSIVLFPWVVYFVIHMFETHPWQSPKVNPQTNVAQIVRMLSQNEQRWTNPAWQQEAEQALRGKGLTVVIRSPSNDVIFDSAAPGAHHWMSNQEVMVLEDGKWVGTVQISSAGKADPAAVIGAVAAAVLAIAFVSYQVGRNVIKPLESMSRAALQIADGDFDFELAESSTLEIRQVRSAFRIMVHGLRESFAKQEKLEEERRFFIGAIAHDLRTPLFSLRGYLDGIQQGIAASPDKVAHYVAVCKDKAAHLERLVSDLFAFTRLESMEQTLQKEQLDLSEVVRQTVSSLESRAMEKGIRLNTSAVTETCDVTGDPHLLERAVTNVLDNALRYTPLQGEIFIGLKKESGRAVLTIRDTGPGFSPADIAHIFEPMYRGDASRSSATGGAGLGLTIARRVFDFHGGALTAANVPGGGAVLSGWLPLDEHRCQELD